MTTPVSTASAPTAIACRSSRCARRPTSSAAITTPPVASTASGRSPADYTRKATKFRCPTGECQPASVWIKAERMFPLIPRSTDRWSKLYRGRAAVEREFGRLKHEWALAPLRVRGLDRVRLHADLTILAKLACALSRARALTLAA